MASETCASCGKPITNERVTYQGKVYHHGHQPGTESSKTGYHYDEFYIGDQVDLPDEGWGIDVGSVESWDGGWFVRINDTGELTGPWSDDELSRVRKGGSKTADLAATGCPASGDGLHKWLRYTSDVLPITATCAYCGETAETGTRGGWGGTIGKKTALVWTQNREASSDSPTYNLHVIGTIGAEVYSRSGQWFWNAWLAHGIASDGGPLEEPRQAQREAEAWIAGSGANVITGSKVAFDEEAKCPQCGEHGDYADESGAPLVASPGAISPPLSWGGKLVCPIDGTVWQYVSEEKRDRDVRQFNDIHYSKMEVSLWELM